METLPPTFPIYYQCNQEQGDFSCLQPRKAVGAYWSCASLLGFTVPHPPPQCTTKAKGNLNHKEVISFLLPSPLFQPDRGNGILASQQQAISLCYLNQSAIIKFFMKLPRPSVFIKAALKHFLLETKEKNYLY